VSGLTELECGENHLTKLDLSPVSGLTELECRNNHLTELDLSPVPGLTTLGCDEFLRLRNAPSGIEVNHG
jgi:Leucine-rich repeat (LRR) protein